MPAETRADCLALDAADPLGFARARFALPEGVIYLDGNSLGARPRGVGERLRQVVEDEWGEGLIRSWNDAGWIDAPARVGAKIAPLIGARANEVICADSTSVNLFKLAAAAVKLAAPRRTILTEPGNFPTDLYVLQGLRRLLGETVALKTVAADQIAGALDDSVAVLVLTHAHYKTGALHDMAGLCARARAVGALTLWDLSHSAGALEVALNRDGADLAVGCGYKYLNGGPGAPAFVYVAEALQARLESPLSGWMGHAEPFAFEDGYRPARGVARQLSGTPAILGLAALEEGLATFEGVAMADLRAKSQALGELFLARLAALCPGAFPPACPLDATRRGSQVSVRCADGLAMMAALIEAGVIGDFRAPDVMRFGFAPLYVRHVDVWDAAETLAAIHADGRWREPRFQKRAAVT